MHMHWCYSASHRSLSLSTNPSDTVLSIIARHFNLLRVLKVPFLTSRYQCDDDQYQYTGRAHPKLNIVDRHGMAGVLRLFVPCVSVCRTTPVSRGDGASWFVHRPSPSPVGNTTRVSFSFNGLSCIAISCTYPHNTQKSQHTKCM